MGVTLLWNIKVNQIYSDFALTLNSKEKLNYPLFLLSSKDFQDFKEHNWENNKKALKLSKINHDKNNNNKKKHL